MGVPGGLAWKGHQSSAQLELAGPKVSPDHVLPNGSHTRQPPPAQAYVHAQLFVTATGSTARRCQRPSPWGRGRVGA